MYIIMESLSELACTENTLERALKEAEKSKTGKSIWTLDFDDQDESCLNPIEGIQSKISGFETDINALFNKLKEDIDFQYHQSGSHVNILHTVAKKTILIDCIKEFKNCMSSLRIFSSLIKKLNDVKMIKSYFNDSKVFSKYNNILDDYIDTITHKPLI